MVIKKQPNGEKCKYLNTIDTYFWVDELSNRFCSEKYLTTAPGNWKIYCLKFVKPGSQ